MSLSHRQSPMVRTARGTMTAAMIIVLLVLSPSVAHACTRVPSVSMASVAASLTGQSLPEEDAWILEGVTIMGLVETTVVHTWEATLDYEAAAAHSVTRAWGTVAEGRPNADRIRGGESRGPFAERTSCGLAGGGNVGHRTYNLILGEGRAHPANGPLTPDVEAVLVSAFGEPDVREVPDFDERHPSYDWQYGTVDYFTWGRLTWAGVALLLLPVGAFGAWLFSTRHD